MNLFFNIGERRIRSGWRLLLQFILFYLLTGIIAIPVLSGDQYDSMLLLPYISAVATVISLWIASRLWDYRPFSEYGLTIDLEWLTHFLIGSLIAAFAMLFIFAVHWLTGWAEITGFGWERRREQHYILVFLSYFGSMLMVGFYEEAVFRGYQIRNLAEGLNGSPLSPAGSALAAVGITSLLFGILHAFNPGASLISTFNIVLAGVVLAVPFIMTGSLALSVGMHFAWNFFQGGVFGFPVSGLPNRTSLIQISREGPDIITGGGFGPEAGLIGILGMGLMLFLSLWFIKGFSWPLQIKHTFLSPYLQNRPIEDEGGS
jgi:uncharacterized protein